MITLMWKSIKVKAHSEVGEYWEKRMFSDRLDAGRQLATALTHYRNQSKDVEILGLPRGGVVVAYQVAKALNLPLDVTCPRKIGAPFNPELAIGAVTETGQAILNDRLIAQLAVSEEYLQQVIDKETKRAQHRLKLFRKNRPPRNLEGKTVILVDDGLATGATMKAAIQSVKYEGADRIVVAVPVAPEDTLAEMEQMADEVICLATPLFFSAIGQFYTDFSQVEDDEVCRLLAT